MDAQVKAAIDRRLARVEGQVRGLRRMVEEDSYCVDVLTQLAAVRSALNQIGAELASGHVKSCILGHSCHVGHDHAKEMSQDELIEELEITLSRLMR
jgi:CsoR family transcriptional regulator, copper-sensing transcriptional repressor